MKLVYNGWYTQKWRVLTTGRIHDFQPRKNISRKYGWEYEYLDDQEDITKYDLMRDEELARIGTLITDSAKRGAFNSVYNIKAETVGPYFGCIVCDTSSKKGYKLHIVRTFYCIDCWNLVDDVLVGERKRLIHAVFNMPIPPDVARVILKLIWRLSSLTK